SIAFRLSLSRPLSTGYAAVRRINARVGRGRARPLGALFPPSGYVGRLELSGGRVIAQPPPLVEVEGLTKHFPVSQGVFLRRSTAFARAVDDVSFSIPAGTTLGLVGESGCGKTTTGRMVVRLLTPTAGRVRFAGRDVTAVRGDELRKLRG